MFASYSPGTKPDSCNPRSQFTCSNGECINKDWKCDGQNDCSDSSDENDCSSEYVLICVNLQNQIFIFWSKYFLTFLYFYNCSLLIWMGK